MNDIVTPRWDGRRWRIQVQREGRRHSFSSKTAGTKGRRECLRAYENWLFGEASGEKTVGRIVAEYLADIKTRCGDNSPAYEQCECYTRLYIVPKCGSKKIRKMTLRDWQAVINEAQGRKKALSEKTLKNIRGMIMGIIKFGYEDYQCELLRGKLYIPKGRCRMEKEILQKEDVRKLFEPSDLWYHPVFLIGCLCGLRPGEILGLKKDDIDGNRLVLRRAVNARGHITEGKNANAKRIIPLGSMAMQIIRDTIQRNEDYNLHTDWIFCSQDGSQGNQHTMRNQWRKLKKERGLPPHSTVYCLRHTFVSLLKTELSEQNLKLVLGHSASFDSVGTYGHYVKGEEKKVADVIDLTFKKIAK